MSQDESTPTRSRRERSTRHPGVPLAESVELCKFIEARGLDGLTAADIATALGYKNIKTNTFSARLSAARQFGLLVLKDEGYSLTPWPDRSSTRSTPPRSLDSTGRHCWSRRSTPTSPASSPRRSCPRQPSSGTSSIITIKSSHRPSSRPPKRSWSRPDSPGRSAKTRSFALKAPCPSRHRASRTEPLLRPDRQTPRRRRRPIERNPATSGSTSASGGPTRASRSSFESPRASRPRASNDSSRPSGFTSGSRKEAARESNFRSQDFRSRKPLIRDLKS